MEKLSVAKRPLLRIVVSILLAAFTSGCLEDQPESVNYSIASSDYGIMAEKSLDLMSSFNLETWSTMLSDSVVYYFPDESRAKLVGKTALLNWWENYRNVSGLQSMSIEDASYLPVYVNAGPGNRGTLSGIQVIAYFSNRLIYKDYQKATRMNFIIHFDENKLIDRYYTYYDRSDAMAGVNEL